MQRLRDAMAAHPEYVAGEGRSCTELMRAMGGRVAIKTGAEAVFIAMIPEKKLGLAMKIEDGNSRASEAALVAATKASEEADARVAEMDRRAKGPGAKAADPRVAELAEKESMLALQAKKRARLDREAAAARALQAKLAKQTADEVVAEQKRKAAAAEDEEEEDEELPAGFDYASRFSSTKKAAAAAATLTEAEIFERDRKLTREMALRALPPGWTRHGPDEENDIWYENTDGTSQFSNPNYTPKLPDGWIERQDAEGDVWFVNQNTKASQYQRPKEGGKRRRVRVGGKKPETSHQEIGKPLPPDGGRRKTRRSTRGRRR